MDMRSNGENDDDALQRRKLSLLVFWPHVHAGTVYFDRDGELKMSVGEKKNDDDEGETPLLVFGLTCTRERFTSFWRALKMYVGEKKKLTKERYRERCSLRSTKRRCQKKRKWECSK